MRTYLGEAEAGMRISYQRPQSQFSQYLEFDGLFPFGGKQDKQALIRMKLGATVGCPFGGIISIVGSLDGVGNHKWRSSSVSLGYRVQVKRLFGGTVGAKTSVDGGGLNLSNDSMSAMTPCPLYCSTN